MTTGWLIVNIVMGVVATILVAGPAVLVPMLLDRDYRAAKSVAESWGATPDEFIALTGTAPVELDAV